MDRNYGPASVAGSEYRGNPVSGRITDRFGTLTEWRRQQGLGAHQALDIAADEGTGIFSGDAGTFVYSGWNDGGLGYISIVDHGDYACLYAHQPRTFHELQPGDPVKRGQLVGRVGHTGTTSRRVDEDGKVLATGDHVHWMVSTKKSGAYWDFTRGGGGCIDPLTIIASVIPSTASPKGSPVTVPMVPPLDRTDRTNLEAILDDWNGLEGKSPTVKLRSVESVTLSGGKLKRDTLILERVREV